MEFRRLRELANEHSLAKYAAGGFIAGYAAGVVLDLASGSYPLFSLSNGTIGAELTPIAYMIGD
ncbi:MAG: hypothetical protein HYU56_02855 [Candidatus Aenigmarchaeota archaeon]|nr:hypothetical protein [Candidatus Aenigmarchaeota archaeon]